MPQLLLQKRAHIDHVIHHVLLGEEPIDPTWYEQEPVLLIGPFMAPLSSPMALVHHISLETTMTWGRAVYQDVAHSVIVDEQNFTCAINVWECAMTVSRYYYSPSLLLGTLLNDRNIKYRDMLINLMVEKMGQAGGYCPRWKYDVNRLLMKHITNPTERF